MADDRNNMGRDRDLVLAPGEFAFVLDTTKGLVNTIVGPNKVSMSNTDQPVVWDRMKRRIVRTEVDSAIQTNSIAPEGFYIALYNPAVDDKFPREQSSAASVPLKVGHRVNIPGPAHFPLWPGQMADVIKGHHLRSNQYLLAQVYNDQEATENWKKAVVKPQTPTGDTKTSGDTKGTEGGTPPTTGSTPEPTSPAAVIEPHSFTPGQLIVIKGTDVAFFIPPTGIKVVPEEGTQNYVREAVTLERLEYCILLDEDGNKRFVKGPDVVFPEPTEQFIVKDGSRKFKAIELNETTGLYIKVIADYEENGHQYKAGDELFITGKEQAIYFQREEHSVIRYGDQTKHYAVAIPAGEGRYVLNRNSGVITLVRGPKMLLCDPRYEVIVRRVLAEKTARLWYPNNEKVVQVNKELEQANKTEDASQYTAGRVAAANYNAIMDAASTISTSGLLKSSRQIAGDQFTRGTTFQPPRTLTLDTKYEGAVSISVWTGYAVLVINKTGDRRVVEGPENILLEYDETLAPLELSTGTPKTDLKLLNTVYLRVHNNKVSDVVFVETKDLVKVKLTLSYRVNFEGDDKLKWFEVENYVRLLCDHMRSRVRNIAKRRNIEEFYENAIDIIRDAILGAPAAVGQARPGLAFAENNMRVYDLEVLDVAITDQSVAALLLDAQSDALSSAIRLSKAERALSFTRRSEEIKQETAAALNRTVLAEQMLKIGEIKGTLDINLQQIAADSKTKAERLAASVAEQDALNKLNAEELARQKAAEDQHIANQTAEVELLMKKLEAETREIVERAEAVAPNLAVALTTFSDSALVEKISTALGPMAAMSGVSAAEVLAQLFRGTPLSSVMDQLGARTRMLPAVKAES